ncbi:MAG: RsmB/NOP family class I SAM-dependent RNA methyltransferase, partial [Chlamydiia bacterium]|nr:RsmB/NOP family class I SAM-dependent RNA methyltransferase [Chlamydiia bacterium]
MKPFRRYHLLNILKEGESSSLPLDAFLRDYFRKHKAVGSKDRAEICTNLYGIIRWKGLIDARCTKPITWEKRIEVFLRGPSPQNDDPLHVQVSFPKAFFDRLVSAYGEKRAAELCLSSNEQAPVTVRINPLVAAREALFDKWKSDYPIALCKQSNLGITFEKRINFFALPEFKAGAFEVQDEGSQIIASYVQAKPNDHVLDFCAGSGGKTLAFAHQMEGKGQIYLYDIRPHALLEGKKRLKRAGIQNAQLLDAIKLKKKGLLERMDWILLDVPCSGSGTLRRNPDMKWKFKDEMIPRL